MLNEEKRQSGFSTIWLLGFAAIILISGLAIFDLTRVYIEREKLSSAADAAANAGATAIDEERILTGDGKVRLDTSGDVSKGTVPRCEQMLLKWAEPGGGASTVLDVTAPTKSKCEIESNVGVDQDKYLIASASGKVNFTLFGLFGVSSKELTVSSRARTSCSSSSACD